ncbi:uncharacterized protein Tco025E_02635 [Trypanosoma conorhini]|uniref:Leucine-rich repeat protein (LRRP) n=1 Tax=Trypanosoma conorhini TaxID=83891 RepID=A0A422Q2S7_9TRYP|nr:uncharacterized protein Tco025E_02635 [Trypanosoma conorhini]RNF24276.1 hypothetical protein Tco025E_02635 [Trypanosoma conorhini]
MQIDLSHRNLIDFDPTAFSTDDEREVLNAITRLDVSCNSLSSLYGLRWLSNLTSLDVSNNNVASLHGLPLPLRQLNASFNVLTDVDGLSPLLHLEVLVVSHNQITTLEDLPAAVRIVDASSNRLASLTGLEKCRALEELQVRQNMIQNVEELAPIQRIPSLKALTLAENPVTNSKRRLAAVHAMLPLTLEVVDLPPLPWTKPASAVSSSSPAVSLNTTTVRDTINLSCFSAASTARVSRNDSTHGSPSRSQASCPHMPVRTTPQQEKQQQSRSGSGTTCWITGNGAMPLPPAAVLHGDVPPLSDTAQGGRLGHDACGISAMQAPRREVYTEVDASLPSIRAQRPSQSTLEHLQSELDECRRSCFFYREENAGLRLRIQQLQSTNEDQARMNAILVEENERLERICGGSLPLKQAQSIAASTDVKVHVMADGAAHVSPSSRGQLLRLPSGSRNNVGEEAIVAASQHPYVEESLEEATSAEAKTELRRGARSLAALFMSLVPKPAMDRPQSGSAFAADASNHNDSRHHRTAPQSAEDTSSFNTNAADNGLRNPNVSDKGGRRRTVSFGGFAYCSPPSW